MGEVLLPTDLQRAVIRKAIRTKFVDGIVEYLIAIWRENGIVTNLGRPARCSWTVARSIGRRGAECDLGLGLVSIVIIVEIPAMRSGVGNFQNALRRKLILETNVPLFGVWSVQLGTHSEKQWR